MEYYQVIKGGLGTWYLLLGYPVIACTLYPLYQKGFLIRQKQIIEKCKYYYSNIRIGVFVKYDTKVDHLKYKPYS